MQDPRLDRRAVAGGGLALALSGLLPRAAEAAAPPSKGQLDLRGAVLTFEETFRRFDRQVAFDNPKGRWRTNFGYGDGPDSLDSRTLTNNKEKQVYVDPEFRGLGLNPFKVTPRGLAIVADRTPSFIKPHVWNLPYTSGVITTRDSFSQLYGYFEIRARLPKGKGLWPAFWLLPRDGSWPPELDVMENLGGDIATFYATAHSKVMRANSRPVRPGVDLSAGVHAYGAAWGRRDLIWYFDRREVARQPTPADMHSPMYLLANLGVGGNWTGPPDAKTVFPAVYEIEAVRAWRLPV